MAIALSSRRVFTVAPETTRGTFVAPNPTIDAVPLVREAKMTITPERVDRPTLRLSLTKYPDIYPGVATVELDLLVEISGVPPNAGTTAALSSPIWSDLMRSCGFEEVSNATTRNLYAYTFTGFSVGDGAPMRHGETINIDYASGTDGVGLVFGDTYADDDVIYIDETTVGAGTGAITSVSTTAGGSNRSLTSPVRDATPAGPPTGSKLVGFRLRSNVNAMECVSAELYLDGKRLQARGCAGNVEFQLDHGDALKARFTLKGIRQAYADQAMPATPNEQHYVPPTFLGKDVRFRETDSSPLLYGKDLSTIVGGLSTIKFSTGNNVVLRKNSLETAGISFALITDREGTGSFDPDEVADGEFLWVENFRQGKPVRFKGFIGSTDTGDGNSIDIIAPGCVLTQLGDGERDLVNRWDGQFALTGGDYDTTLSGELPGNDNELTIIYR